MARTWQLQTEKLTPEEFALYGRIVSLPTTPAAREGPGWVPFLGGDQVRVVGP
jgi:hypothetical protein